MNRPRTKIVRAGKVAENAKCLNSERRYHFNPILAVLRVLGGLLLNIVLILPEQFLYFRRQGWDDFKGIAHDAIVGNLENGRVLVLVDSHNIL